MVLGDPVKGSLTSKLHMLRTTVLETQLFLRKAMAEVVRMLKRDKAQ